MGDDMKTETNTYGTKLYNLKKSVANCTQTKATELIYTTVKDYYGKLKALWDALADYEPLLTCKCGKCDCNIAQEAEKRQDRDRLHQFLTGLDDEIYGTVRSQQLALDPLPSLNRAYQTVLLEERRLGLSISKIKGVKELVLMQCAVGSRRSEYYVVDLEAERTVIHTPVATLLNERGQGGLVGLGPVIYNVGGETSVNDNFNPALLNGDNHIHLGASCVELNIPYILQSLRRGDDNDNDDDFLELGSNKWKAAPLMKCRRAYPNVASLGGNVYALGDFHKRSSCVGEVFVPRLGKWQDLPPPPDDVRGEFNRCYLVSTPVIPDEKNGRLLVHFETGDSLYAYYPAIGTWELLSQKDWQHPRDWYPAAALVDDVLYFFSWMKSDCIGAYDLQSKKWLKVVYAFKFDVTICVLKFLDMLNLGNGILCLANSFTYAEDKKRTGTTVQFVKFKVQRTSSEQVLVTLIDVKRILFENRKRVVKFIDL